VFARYIVLFEIIFIFISHTCNSQVGQKANVNLMGDKNKFNLKELCIKNNKISITTFDGYRCLKVAPTNSKPKAIHYVHYKPHILPFKIKTRRCYIASVYLRTENSKGKLQIDIYNSQNKYLKSYKTRYISSKKWRKIEVRFYSPEDNCRICPIFFNEGNEGTVYWDKFDIHFAATPPMFYFRKMSKNGLNIYGTVDYAYFPNLLEDSQLSARISLKDPLNDKTIFNKQFPLKRCSLSANLDLSRYNFGVYRFEIILENKNKKVFRTKMTYVPGIDCAYKEMQSFNKQVNSEVGVDIKEAVKVTPSSKEQKSGFILFNRPEPRWIQPDSLPLPHERVKNFQIAAAPGDYIFFTIALFPLKDLKDVEFIFSSENSNFSAIQTGMLKYLPQQTNYEYSDKIKKYWIIPEIIDKVRPVNLKKGRVQQYSLGVKIPENACGMLEGVCIVKTKGKLNASIPVNIKVVPVKLTQPDDMVFGIFPDQIRWTLNPEEYTDAKILEELKDIKEHGYNSFLLTTAPPIVKIKFKNGYYKLDLKHLKRILNLFVKAGFDKHPYILSTYALEKIMNSKVGLPKPQGYSYTPEYKKYIDQFYKQIKDALCRPELPEPIIHGVDEASSGEKLQRSVRILKAAKEHGFRTACTLFQWTFEYFPEYYDVIDVRIYSNVGFWEMYTPEDARKRRKDTINKNNIFWGYGSGCYANFNPAGRPVFRNTRQDGCLTENRYMHGIFAYRAKLKGEWSWTFCRWRGSTENDFDNPKKRKGEFKDSYIVFPNKNGIGYKNTLQWEALRQGWQDYRALYTLDTILQGKKNRTTKAIKLELNKKIAQIPWRNYTQYSNENLNKLREWILDKIYELKNREDKIQ
jgi:hypothetical protein